MAQSRVVVRWCAHALSKVLALRPSRKVLVRESQQPYLIVASDAQVEHGTWPGGGVLEHDPLGSRQARHCQRSGNGALIHAT